jgi:hypothetical protein
VHAGVLVTRGMAADRLPWGNMYEFATAVVLVGVVVYLVLAVRIPAVRDIGAFVLGPVVISPGRHRAVPLHRDRAAGRRTALELAGRARLHGHPGLRHLLRQRHRQRPLPAEASLRRPRCRGRGLAPRPAARRGDAGPDRPPHRGLRVPDLDLRRHRRAIWAESAWGRYWGWDPKETWAFIAWVVYAGYLHARTTAGWRGRPAAWVNVVGLAVMVFNLLYVNMVSTGLHSYGGLGLKKDPVLLTARRLAVSLWTGPPRTGSAACR